MWENDHEVGMAIIDNRFVINYYVVRQLLQNGEQPLLSLDSAGQLIRNRFGHFISLSLGGIYSPPIES